MQLLIAQETWQTVPTRGKAIILACGMRVLALAGSRHAALIYARLFHVVADDEI